MKFRKRAWVSLIRQPMKTAILFILFVLLSSMAAGAISTGKAIQVAEVNLRRSIPAVATLIHDNSAILAYLDYHGVHPDWESALSSETIEKIGNLPYVRIFDYAVLMNTFHSHELDKIIDTTPYLSTMMTEEIALDLLLSMFWESDIEGAVLLNAKGIYNADVFVAQEGLIELLDGRLFTHSEMINGTPVVMISQAFAEANDLNVGNRIALERHLGFFIEDLIQKYGEFWKDLFSDMEVTFEEELVTFNEEVIFEVVGIFMPTITLDHNSNVIEIQNHMEINSTIYMPISIAQNPEPFWQGRNERIIFVLYDSLYLDAFSESAYELIPAFWLTNNQISVYRDMSSSLESIRNISGNIMLGAITASLIILGLLMTLFLYDRKHEIGIYMALGERKSKVMFQILFESLSLFVVAIIVSVFVGNFLADHFSQVMLKNEMSANVTPMNLDSGIHTNDFNQMGFGFWMTHEEMMEIYAVTLNGSVVLLFMSVGILMILLSTILPIIYLSKLKPKDTLMKSSIG